MYEPIRSGWRRWADHSIGAGMLARRLRRFAQQRLRQSRRVGNVAMLHAGRCGSSVLGDLLGQHPDVHWASELFEDLRPAYYRMDADARARQVIGDAMWRVDAPWFGFESKVLPEQHLRAELANRGPEDYVTLLQALGFRHFILLDRRNHLRRAISAAIGARSGVWNSSAPVPPGGPLRLDPRHFVSYQEDMPLLEHFRRLEDAHQRLRRRLAGTALLELTYEDDIEGDPRVAYARACAFLGVAEQPVTVRLRKLNPQRPDQLLENFAEIEALLRGTRYEWMLRA